MVTDGPAVERYPCRPGARRARRSVDHRLWISWLTRDTPVGQRNLEPNDDRAERFRVRSRPYPRDNLAVGSRLGQVELRRLGARPGRLTIAPLSPAGIPARTRRVRRPARPHPAGPRSCADQRPWRASPPAWGAAASSSPRRAAETAQ